MTTRQALVAYDPRSAAYVTLHKGVTTAKPFSFLRDLQIDEEREVAEHKRVSDTQTRRSVRGKKLSGSATLYQVDDPVEAARFLGFEKPASGGFLGTENVTLNDGSFAEQADYYIVFWNGTGVTATATMTILLDNVTVDKWGVSVKAGDDIEQTFSFSGDAMIMTPAAGAGA